MNTKLLLITGITIFLVGIGYGLITAFQLTVLPIEASTLTDRWISYLTGYGLSCGVMSIGGCFVYLGASKNNKL